MSMYGRTVVDPNTIRSASVLATVTTILLGIGWLLAAGWSSIVSSSRIVTPHFFEDYAPIVTIPLSLGLWGGFLVAGATWAIWQRHVALAAAPGEGVRNPDWHAQAWFAPIVMWWEPLRNVRELSAYFLPPQRRWVVRAWWVAWIAFRITGWLVIWQLWMPASVLLVPEAVALASAVATLASTALAIVLIQLLTTAALAKVREPVETTYVGRPIRFSLALFIVGIICRLATPVAVLSLIFAVSDRFP